MIKCKRCKKSFKVDIKFTCRFVGSFVFIVPTDLLGNRLSEMKIRSSFFFLFVLSTESSESHADKSTAQKRIDELIATVIQIVLLWLPYY